MFDAILGNGFLVVLVLVFIAVLLALEASYMVWQSYRGPKARKLRTRLEAIAGETVIEKSVFNAFIENDLLPLLRGHRFGFAHERPFAAFVRSPARCPLFRGMCWMPPISDGRTTSFGAKM